MEIIQDLLNWLILILAGADGIKVLKVKPEFNSVFFYFQCLSLNLPNKGYHRHFRYLKECNFIYPNLETQTKLATLFTACTTNIHTIKQRLESLLLVLKTYRQSVLARAVSGQLTEQWRAENGVKLEDWNKGILKDFVEKPVYGTSSKSEKIGKIPVLRMGNIQSGFLDRSDLLYTSNNEEIEKYKLKKYDILFNRTNSPELVVKTSIYLGEREAIFAGYLIRVRTKEMLDPEFLNFHLNSAFAKNYCLEVKSDGVNQSNINSQKLLAYPINLPPFAEQTQITQAVKMHLDFADSLETKIKTALASVNVMTQAVLAKGFRGEL